MATGVSKRPPWKVKAELAMNDVWERCISDMIIRNNFLTSILLKSKSLSSFLIYVKTQTGLLRG